MSDLRTAAQQALDDLRDLHANHNITYAGTISRLEAALAQQAEPDAYGYASRLAVSIWQWNYKDTAPNWKPLDDLMGVLTQIDNMTSGLTRLAQQAEPVAGVAENATTQQQIEQTPPSDYRRGYWAGFAIGKREGRIEAEDELAQQAEPVEPYCYVYEYDGVFGLHREFYPLPYNGMKPSRTVPVYTTPPQRAPLTQEEATALVQSVVSKSDRPIGMVAYGLLVVGAVERAHGIGDNT